MSQEEIWEGVRFEEQMRTDLKNYMWVYDSYTSQRDMLRVLGIEIDYEWLQSIGYSKGPLSAVMFFRNREGQNERIHEFIRQMKNQFPEYSYN